MQYLVTKMQQCSLKKYALGCIFGAFESDCDMIRKFRKRGFCKDGVPTVMKSTVFRGCSQLGCHT